jgi:hypothetical protein
VLLLLLAAVVHCRAHVHNVDDLFVCALPYHSTPEFARLVAVLQLQGTPWEWLSLCQQSGAPPPRNLLVQACINHQVGHCSSSLRRMEQISFMPAGGVNGCCVWESQQPSAAFSSCNMLGAVSNLAHDVHCTLSGICAQPAWTAFEVPVITTLVARSVRLTHCPFTC